MYSRTGTLDGMRGIVAVALLAGACGEAGYDLVPVTSEHYASLEMNPVMAGGELWAWPAVYTDYDGHARATRVSVTPPELAEVSLVDDGRFVVIRPSAVQQGTLPAPVPEDGHGWIHVELGSGVTFDRTFWVEPRVSSSIEVEGVPLSAFPERRLPGERLAVFEGERLPLTLRHRAADGTVVLGHDDTTWSAEGVQLAEAGAPAMDDQIDWSLRRHARAISAGEASIRAGGASLALDIVPQRTTARVEVIGAGASRFGAEHPIQLAVGGSLWLNVMAYTADGRYIFGGPPFVPVVVSSTDYGVAALENGPTSTSRSIRISGYGSGTATLTIGFDGQSINVPITVE
jgi:hypothetical protein